MFILPYPSPIHRPPTPDPDHLQIFSFFFAHTAILHLSRKSPTTVPTQLGECSPETPPSPHKHSRKIRGEKKKRILSRFSRIRVMSISTSKTKRELLPRSTPFGGDGKIMCALHHLSQRHASHTRWIPPRPKVRNRKKRRIGSDRIGWAFPSFSPLRPVVRRVAPDPRLHVSRPGREEGAHGRRRDGDDCRE